jgi:excisionase family DNA binding protein
MKTPQKSPSVNTVQTACYRLQICRGTLYKLIRTGKIETLHFGTRRMIPESEILRLSEEGF